MEEKPNQKYIFAHIMSASNHVTEGGNKSTFLSPVSHDGEKIIKDSLRRDQENRTLREKRWKTELGNVKEIWVKVSVEKYNKIEGNLARMVVGREAGWRKGQKPRRDDRKWTKILKKKILRG